MSEQQGYRMGIGASSVLLIFVVLCLTTLGVLTYASARASQTLADKRQVQVEAYYAATAEAERAIAEIDGALLGGTTPAPSGVKDFDISDDGMIFFTVPAGEAQQLEVWLRVNEPDGGPRYTVTRYQLINTSDWMPSDTWTDLVSPAM